MSHNPAPGTDFRLPDRPVEPDDAMQSVYNPELPAESRPIYEQLGITVEEHNRKGQFHFPLAATFIVSSDGTLVSSFVKADYTSRQDPWDVVEILKSLKE